MPHHRRIGAAQRIVAGLLLFAPASLVAQATTLDDPDVRLLYPLAQKVQVMAEICLKDHAGTSAGVTAALTDWNAKHARPQLDSLIERTFKRRAAFGRSIMRSLGPSLFGGDPGTACATFERHIATPEHDLSLSNPQALQNARRKLGAPPLVTRVATTPVPRDTTSAVVPTPISVPRPASTAARALSGIPAPAGWMRKATTDGSALFTVTKPDSGTATLVIATPQPRGGATIDDALRHWLRTQLASRLDLSLKHTVTVGRTVHGNPAAWADETADFHNSRDGLRILGIAVAHRDNTFTPVLMFTRDDADQYHYAKDVGEWFSRITLPGDTGSLWSPLNPAATGGLNGLWFGTQLRSQLNIYGGMDMIADREYIAMYPNGFAYRELPEAGGVDNLDAATLCATDRRDCGTYRVEPTRIVFDWFTQLGLVETDTAAIERPRQVQPVIEYEGTTMSRVQPVQATRLDGAFTSIDGTSSGPNGSIMLARSITFHADGRYEATRAVGFSSTPGASSGTESGSVVGYSPNVGPNRGTYDIRGYTLTMRPENGPVRLATIIFFDDVRPVTSVLIDDNYYRK